MKELIGINEPVRGLDGNLVLETPEGPPITPKLLIAGALARGQAPGQEIRAMDLALRIFNADGVLELEDVDFNLAKEMVEKDQTLNNMAKAIALKVFTTE